MKRAMSGLASGVVFASGTAAQSLTAWNLAGQCSAGNKTEERAVCILVISTFMDGFIEGVGRESWVSTPMIPRSSRGRRNARERDGHAYSAGRRQGVLHSASLGGRPCGNVGEARARRTLVGWQGLSRGFNTNDCLELLPEVNASDHRRVGHLTIEVLVGTGASGKTDWTKPS